MIFWQIYCLGLTDPEILKKFSRSNDWTWTESECKTLCLRFKGLNLSKTLKPQISLTMDVVKGKNLFFRIFRIEITNKGSAKRSNCTNWSVFTPENSQCLRKKAISIKNILFRMKLIIFSQSNEFNAQTNRFLTSQRLPKMANLDFNRRQFWSMSEIQ